MAPAPLIGCTVAFLLMASQAAAQSPPSNPTTARPTPVAPFQLRGLTPRDSLRLDSTLATYRRDDTRGLVALALLSIQTRLSERASLQLKWGFVDHLVSNGASRNGVVNPTVSFLFAFPVSAELRLAVSLTVGAPVGSGGGNSRDPETARMQRQAALARSSMDNTTFAVNDVGFPTGVSVAYVAHGLTCQVDATVIPSVRARGEDVQPDSSKVNATSGLFIGQHIVAQLAVGAELRYQRYLSTPAAVASDPSTRDNLSGAVGARLSADLGRDISLRPGLSYTRSLSGAGAQQSFQGVQLDLPLVF